MAAPPGPRLQKQPRDVGPRQVAPGAGEEDGRDPGAGRGQGQGRGQEGEAEEGERRTFCTASPALSPSTTASRNAAPTPAARPSTSRLCTGGEGAEPVPAGVGRSWDVTMGLGSCGQHGYLLLMLLGVMLLLILYLLVMTHTFVIWQLLYPWPR